ncbi:MAG: DUF5693 family protein [Elusimicrobia bacterium]|nr:DUF5693 family protein [Elusimicrobiota bacterium]
MNYARYALFGVILAATVIVGTTIVKRISIESRVAPVEICLDFNAANIVALRCGIPITTVLAAAHDQGVSSALLSEESLGQVVQLSDSQKSRYGISSKTSPNGSFLPEYWNASLPVGFSQEKIKSIESSGLSVVLRPQNMGDPLWIVADKKLTGRKILLDGKEVPGYPKPAVLFSHLPDNLLVVLEFASGMGIDEVKRFFPRQIILGHAIFPSEQFTMASDEMWIARWMRAVRERGNRFLLVYLREEETVARNVARLEQLQNAVRAEGFVVGPVTAPLYPFGNHSAMRLFLVLVCAVVFPVGAIACSRVLTSPFVRFCVVNAVTLFGGLAIASLLFDGSFMQRIFEIPFVKIAMTVPLLLSPLIIFSADELKLLWRKSLQVRHLLVFSLIVIIFSILMLRTGNVSHDWARPEAGMRQWLEGFLSVRPRTKEFLFGQPLLFAGFASGNPWLVWLGMVGQVSIINTFLHAHTPVLISLLRTMYGMLIGCSAGWALAYALRRFKKL